MSGVQPRHLLFTVLLLALIGLGLWVVAGTAGDRPRP